MPVDTVAVERAQQVDIKPLIDTRAIEPTKEALEMKFDTSNIDALLNGDAGAPIIKIDGEVIRETPKTPVETPVITPSVEKKVETLATEKKIETPVSEPILKPPVEVKKEELPKVETKKEEVKAPDMADLSKLIKPPGADEDKFDYTLYDAATQLNLRNMSRQSRDWVAGQMKELQNLRQGQKEVFLQHEEGYVLSPEFKQLQQKDYYNKTEAQAWQEALLNIRQGKPYKNITGFDSQSGRPIYSAEQQPTDADQIRVENNLNKCLGAVENNRLQAQQLAGTHTNRVKADLATIDSVRKERFSWAQDPKILDYSMKTSSGTEKKLREIQSDFKSVWPSYMSSHPAVQVAADLMVALEIRTAELREALSKAAVANIKVGEAKLGEPKSDHQPGGDGKSTYKIGNQDIPKTFSLDMMPI